MPWVNLHESGLDYSFGAVGPGTTQGELNNSTVTFEGFPPEGLGFNGRWTITIAGETQPTFMRVTTVTMESDGPFADQFFTYTSTENVDEDVFNSSGEVGVFEPSPLEVEVSRHFERETVDMSFTVAYGSNVTFSEFLIEVFIEAGPPGEGCFWTDYKGVTEDCDSAGGTLVDLFGFYGGSAGITFDPADEHNTELLTASTMTLLGQYLPGTPYEFGVDPPPMDVDFSTLTFDPILEPVGITQGHDGPGLEMWWSPQLPNDWVPHDTWFYGLVEVDGVAYTCLFINGSGF